MNKRTTIKDIAHRIGVTEMAVALALENDKSVPLATRQKIQKAVRELEYNSKSKKPSTKKKRIAVISSKFYPPFIREVVEGVESTFPENNYRLNYYSTRKMANKGKELFEELVHEKSADAFIVIGLEMHEDVVELMNEKELPFIMIERECENTNTFVVDNVQGGFDATEYLISRGCKNILVVAGGPNHSSPQDDRVQGYKEALGQYKIKFNKNNIIYAEHLNFDVGRGVFNKHLRDKKDFDAIFCAGGDITAIGIMHEAKLGGRAIPDDFSVMGFDDMDPAVYVTPSLTTVRQPVKEMGKKSAELIMSILSNKKWDKKDRIVFETQIVVRKSV